MRKLLRIILTTLFPLSEHGRLLEKLSPEAFLMHYQELYVHGVITLAPYHSPNIQAAVAACKFENNIDAAKLLATLMNHWLAQHYCVGITLIIPIPLSATRLKERHFNQVSRVLSYLPPTSNNVLIQDNLLCRTKDTVRQTSLNRLDRLQNIEGAFMITPQLSHSNWSNIGRVIICDDVTTTGATLHAAKKALTPHLPPHVEIICVAWAH